MPKPLELGPETPYAHCSSGHPGDHRAKTPELGLDSVN